jgi:hypothetical protein
LYTDANLATWEAYVSEVDEACKKTLKQKEMRTSLGKEWRKRKNF